MAQPNFVSFDHKKSDGKRAFFTSSTDIIDYFEPARTFGNGDLAPEAALSAFQQRVLAVPDHRPDTICLREDVTEVAPVRGDDHQTTSVLLVYREGEAAHLWRDGQEGVWQEAPIRVSDPDAGSKVTCFGTTFRVLTKNRTPRAGVPVTLKGFAEMAALFNFQADGTVVAGAAAQDAVQSNKMMNLYFSRYDDADEATDVKAIKDYKRYVGLTKSLDDFLSDTAAAVTIRAFALKAFDIDPAAVSQFKLKQVLTSNLSDPKSYVYQLKDERFVRLAKAFNFDADGKISSPRMAQSENEITRISRSFFTEKTRWDKSETTKKKAEEEAGYYRSQMETIDNVDQLLANRRLLDVMLIAERVDPEAVTDDFLKKIFKSDLNDPKSFANMEPDSRFRELVGAFNFDAKGKIDYQADQGVQNKRALMETRTFSPGRLSRGELIETGHSSRSPRREPGWLPDQ